MLGFTGSEPVAPERRAVKVIGVFPDVLTHCDPGRSLFDPDKSPGGLLEPPGTGLVGMGLPNGALSRDLSPGYHLPAGFPLQRPSASLLLAAEGARGEKASH